MIAPPAGYSLPVPGLGLLRRLARETEAMLRAGDADAAAALINRMGDAVEGIPDVYGSFRYSFRLALDDAQRRMISPGFKGSCHAAMAPITAIVALLGPLFSGRQIVAQFGGPCAVCGIPCVKGETILYDDATKRGAHPLCGSLAK